MEKLNNFLVVAKLFQSQELATFTSFNHPDLDDVMAAHRHMQSLMTSFDSVKKMDLLTAGFECSDRNRVMWEKSGLADKEGFMTKRGGNVKVVFDLVRLLASVSYDACFCRVGRFAGSL